MDEPGASAARQQAEERRRSAVEKELDAIRLHERTARQLRDAAADDRRRAEQASDADIRARWLHSAQRAEERADAAAGRADAVRQRLSAEGEL